MRPLPTPEEMARADRQAIAGGTPGEVLMDRAGRAVARASVRTVGGRYGRRVAVVCGQGNNGGDGFVAARVLRGFGLAVRCLFVGDPGSVGGDASTHMKRLLDAGVPVEPFDAGSLGDEDLVIDALFGTGFRGAARGDAARAIEAINSADSRVLAVDIPSGVDGATGAVQGPASSADITVAIGAEKTGTAVGAGALRAGRVEVADIGITVEGVRTWLSEAADIRRVLPRRPPDAHKRSMGAVSVLGGSEGMSGAVILVCTAALRAGAGYVTGGVTAAVDAIVSVALPEVLTAVVSDGVSLGPGSLERFAPVVERASALAVGPGLGTGEDQARLVARCLAEVELPVVVDADGLNVLAGRVGPLEARHAPAVITPHPAELARLLGASTDHIQADRLAAARVAASRFGCIVILKGYRSIVAEPSGTAVVNRTGGPELATAGTGDVLTGVVAALLAAGVEPFEAAWAAAYVHGLAGAVAAERIGSTGVGAGDVAEALPEALTRVLSP